MKRCPKCKAKVKAVYRGYKCSRCGWSKYEPEKRIWENSNWWWNKIW